MSVPIRPPNRPRDVVATPASTRRVSRPTDAEVVSPLPGERTEAREAEPVLDLEALRNQIAFPVHAVRRRPRLAALVFASVTTCAILAAAFLPREYLIETKIVAQRNVVMPALDNPRRAVPTESDAPTKLAAEEVLSRANLESIVQQADLLAAWTRVRSPLGRLRDRVTRALRGPPTDADRIDAMVGLLQKNLWVTPNDEGTIMIGIVWPDRETGKRIIEVAQSNFLVQRHATEVALITESIQILRDHVQSSQEAIHQSVIDLTEATQNAGRNAALPSRPLTPVPSARAQEITDLRAELAATRTEIADLESSRRQKLDELQQSLDEMRTTYGSAHPEVSAAAQAIATLQGDTLQLKSYRAELTRVRQRLSALGAPDTAIAAATPSEPGVTQAAIERMMRGQADSLENPALMYARSRLKIAIADYEDLLNRQEGATIELETARAAFKFRYTVVNPPELPKRAVRPNVPLLLIGGTILAAVLAVCAATAMDVASGRLLEPWQVGRRLRLDVLGEVSRL